MLTRLSAFAFVSVLVLAAPLARADAVSALARDWAALPERSAVAAAQATPKHQRIEVLRAMLRSAEGAQRTRGVHLVDKLWQHELARELDGRRTAALKRRLDLYARFAPDAEPARGTGRAYAADPGDAAALFPVHAVSVTVRDERDQPIAGARIRAYAADYDVALPVDAPARADADGRAALELPAGRYRLFAASPEDGKRQALLASGSVEVDEACTVSLAATGAVSWRLTGADEADGAPSVQLGLACESHPFLWWSFRPTALAGTILVSRDLELRVEAAGRLAGGRRFLLRGSHESGVVTLDASGEATRTIAWTGGTEEGVDGVDLTVRIGHDPVVSHQVPLARGDQLRVSRGAFDLAYAYSWPGLGRLRFHRKACATGDGDGPWTIRVAEPLQAQVWHRAYQKRYHKLPPYSIRLFLTDARGHVLAAGPPVSLAVLRNGEAWKPAKKLSRQWARDLEGPVATTDLDNVSYRVETRIPLARAVVAGQPSIAVASERYEIHAPAALAAEARALLAAAETVYPGLRESAYRRIRWRKGTITTHATMPRGVRAFSSSNGKSNFSFTDLLRCTRLRDALTATPIMHEHLHTVGYKHADYMDCAGFHIRRSLDDSGAFYMGHTPRKMVAPMVRYLETGESGGRGGKTLPRLLLRDHGVELFRGFLKRQGERRALQAAGLDEQEANAALFSKIAGTDLGPLFRTAHSNVDPERVRAVLDEGAPRVDRASARFRQQLSEVRDALAAGDGPDPFALTIVRAEIATVADPRQQVRSYLRLGELLVANDRESEACKCFREAVIAARRVSVRVVDKTRKESIGVLKGEPLGLGWL